MWVMPQPLITSGSKDSAANATVAPKKRTKMKSTSPERVFLGLVAGEQANLNDLAPFDADQVHTGLLELYGVVSENGK